MTTFAAPSAAGQARFIDLTPDAPTSQAAGTTKAFTATVTDAAGAPVQGAQVGFEETGPGQLDGGFSADGTTSTITVATGPDGRAQASSTVRASESGTQTVTARLQAASTQCGQVFNGQTGRCTDTTTNTVNAAASPSPSVTASASATPSASASSSASPSASATPSTTRSATPSASGSGAPAPACTVPASISLDRDTIIATGSAQITVRATPNSVVEVLAYSRPSTAFRVVRQIEVGGDGVATDRIVPPTNTRLYAQQQGCDASESIVLNVRTQISLNVVRNGVRNYTFSGRLLPARPNGLIASLYRVTSDGRQILTAQQRANAAPGQAGYDASRPAGSYTITRQFTGSGRFGFVVRTGQDLQNAPGSSNVRSLAVF